MKSTAFSIMILAIVSKIIGFGREMVLSYTYGTSVTTDVYLISQTIPSALFSFVGAAIGTSFIPLYSGIFKEKGKLEANRYTSNLCNAFLLLVSIVVAVVLLFTKPIVKLFAIGFTSEAHHLAVCFTRITVFGIYFSALLNIFSGYLRVNASYLIPALMGVPMNLIIIGSLFISTKTNIYVLAIGSVLATASQLLLLVPSIRRTGYQHQLVVDWKDEYLKEMIFIALPVIVGTSVNEINVLVDRTLASSIAVGGISALNYSRRLNDFVQGLFVASVSTVFYPTISKIAAENNIKGLKSSVSEAIAIVNLLVIPATIGAMIFAKEVVVLLFGRGAFAPDAIAMTSNALFYYSIGMIAFGLRDILSRAFYAFQDTKTPMINATIGVVINIVLNLILSKYMGLGGLALATSISAIVTAILMFITLRKKIGPFGLLEITRSFIKISIASVIMGGFAYGSFRLMLLRFSQNLSLIFAIGIGALTYAIIIYFMKIPEVDNTLAALKKKLAGRINGKKDSEPQP